MARGGKKRRIRSDQGEADTNKSERGTTTHADSDRLRGTGDGDGDSLDR